MESERHASASIHEAVIRRDARAIAHFPEAARLVLQQDSDGRTPLLLAAAAGDATLHAADPPDGALNAEAINAADVGGLAPLHWACTQQHHEVVALLPRHGAATNTEDDDGRRRRVAAFSGNARRLSAVLRYVAADGVNAPSGDGLTPLHYAALSGSAAASACCSTRAPTWRRRTRRRTALSWAAAEGHEGVVSQLLRARAEPGSADANGLAPHHAARRAARVRGPADPRRRERARALGGRRPPRRSPPRVPALRAAARGAAPGGGGARGGGAPAEFTRGDR